MHVGVIERGKGRTDLIPTVLSLRAKAEEAIVTGSFRNEFKSVEGTRCKWLWVQVFRMGQQPCHHPCRAGGPFSSHRSCAPPERHGLRHRSPFPSAPPRLPSDFCQERCIGARIPCSERALLCWHNAAA